MLKFAVIMANYVGNNVKILWKKILNCQYTDNNDICLVGSFFIRTHRIYYSWQFRQICGSSQPALSKGRRPLGTHATFVRWTGWLSFTVAVTIWGPAVRPVQVVPADVQSASRTCTDLPRWSVSTSGISWQQTETAICYSRRPRCCCGSL